MNYSRMRLNLLKKWMIFLKAKLKLERILLVLLTSSALSQNSWAGVLLGKKTQERKPTEAELIVNRGNASTNNNALSSNEVNDSVKEAGTNSGDQNTNGAIFSGIMGATLSTRGSQILASTCHRGCNPMGFVLLGMSMLSFKQGAEHMNGAAQSYDFANQFQSTNVDPVNNDDGSIKDPTAAGSLALSKNPHLLELNKNLQNGIKGPHGTLDLKNGTLTTNEGKVYSSSDFASAAAMSAAGFDDKTIGEALALAEAMDKKILKEFKPVTVGLEESSGNGSSTGLDLSGFENGNKDSLLGVNPQSLNAERGLAQENPSLLGMTKSFNGDIIGVATDNIFLMMNRRYALKKNQDAFLKESKK